MADLLYVDPCHHGAYEGGAHSGQQDKFDEDGGRWYFSRKEIEENSPSRRDGIDLKKETYLRKSYCTFLQDLGMRLKVPQVTIATAIIFCHRFFLRQSHARNDRRTIAIVCMFLAGKVEETPRPLKDVILVSYEIIHKKDPAAVQRIKQKEVYEQQKELVLQGERVVLATLGFDLNVHHPYKPLVEAIKKFNVAKNALAQVAWNFVNDGLRTSLCLQFKPHHIAAGAIFLAAKFLKVKLPSDGEKVWWQEFDVTPRQLEEVSNQMLELYEQNRPSQASEAEGSAGVVQRPLLKVPVSNDEHIANTSNFHGAATFNAGTSKTVSSRSFPDGGSQRTGENQNNDRRNDDVQGFPKQRNLDDISDKPLSILRNTGPSQERMKFGSERQSDEDHEGEAKNIETRDAEGSKDGLHVRLIEYKDGVVGQSPQDAMKKINKDKLKAAIEKRKKARGDLTQKKDFMDEDDLIERELENGVELAAESEKSKRERRQSWPNPSNRIEQEKTHHMKHQSEAADIHCQGMKGQTLPRDDFDIVEEGEVEPFDDYDRGYQPSKSSGRKRKAGSTPDNAVEGKQRNHLLGSHNSNYHDSEDRNRIGRHDHSERDNQRYLQENNT